MACHKDSPRHKERRCRHWKKGGRVQATLGYIMVKVPDHPRADRQGYVYEHRLVVEKALGRYLRPEEVVHHINGIRDDNRWANLQVFATKTEHWTQHPRACSNCRLAMQH